MYYYRGSCWSTCNHFKQTFEHSKNNDVKGWTCTDCSSSINMCQTCVKTIRNGEDVVVCTACQEGYRVTESGG